MHVLLAGIRRCRRKRTVLTVVLIAAAVVAAILLGNWQYGLYLDRKYAEETKHMTAEQVVKFYFEGWKHRDAHAMRAVTEDGTPEMDGEFITFLDSLTYDISGEAPATAAFVQEDKPDTKKYADLKVYGVEFTANYPGFISSGFSPGEYWNYVVARKTPSAPWKILEAGFI